MSDDIPREPEHPDQHYEDALASELQALPPDELISDVALFHKHGLQPQVWLNVAFALAAQGTPILIEEVEDQQAWYFGLANSAEELEPTRGRIIDQYHLP